MGRASFVQVAVICLALCSGAQAALRVTAIAVGGQHSVALASDGTVWTWGAVPARVSGLGGVVAIAAGYDHDLAVKGDGTVWQWQGTSTPVQVKDLSGVAAVAAGVISSLALKSDGSVWEWAGQNTPAQVKGLFGIIAVAAGQAHCLALKGDGTVWAWGNNGYGQLGDGSIGPQLVGQPVQASRLTGVTAIAAGYAHSLALKGDGTVWSWGVDGTVAAYKKTPEQVSESAGVVGIAAGSYTSMAVRGDGTVSWWGIYAWADGAPVSQATPAPINGLTGIQKVAVPTYGRQRLALKNDGTVWEWGEFVPADAIQLARVAPVQVSGLSGVKAVAAGGPGGLALTGEGSVWEWSDRSTPVQVSGLIDVKATAMGSNPSSALNTALKGDGSVWEWSGESALLEVGDLTGVITIAAGATSRFAVKGDGTVWEWSGQSTPTQVSGLSGVVAVSVAVEQDWWDGLPWVHSLALKGDGTVWEWTKGRWPVQASELSGVVAIAASETNVALKGDGTVWEWMGLYYGLPTSPVQVSGLTGIVAVAAGSAQASSWVSWDEATGHGLALKEDGTVWAWGDNRFGQLGDGTATNRASPVQVAGLREVAMVAAAAVHTDLGTLPVSLAVKRDGTVWAWGFNEFGRLDRSKPVQVMQPGLPDLAIAMSHAGDFTAGDQGIYSLKITNAGWTATAGTVTVTDTLPPGLTYLSGIGGGWTCSATDLAVTCTNPGSINPGGSSTITLTVRVEAQAWPGVTNLASVTNPSDPNIANNTAGDPTVVRQP